MTCPSAQQQQQDTNSQHGGHLDGVVHGGPAQRPALAHEMEHVFELVAHPLVRVQALGVGVRPDVDKAAAVVTLEAGQLVYRLQVNSSDDLSRLVTSVVMPLSHYYLQLFPHHDAVISRP